MTIDIKIWSDFACPCCFKGEARLNEAIRQLGIADKVNIVYKAFELDPSGRKSNTADAHRLMKLAERRYDADILDRLNTLLFDAYFTEGKDLSSHRVLAAIAADAGMDPQEVAVVLETDRYLDAVHADEHEALLLGVNGVPYFVINGTYVIPGALEVADFKEALRNEMRRRSTAEPLRWNRPHICAPNGSLLIYV